MVMFACKAHRNARTLVCPNKMNPHQIPFNALMVGPTNSGKTKYLVDLLSNEFRGTFDYVILLCPTYTFNKTYRGFAEEDRDFFVLTPDQHHIDDWLRIVSFVFEGTNSLIILDDCAASRDVKKRTNELVNLAFSARHKGLSVWVITQQMTSISKPFRENIAALVLFYTPSRKDMKEIFNEYGGGMTSDEKLRLLSALKRNKYSKLIFSLRHPFEINLEY